MPAHVPVKPFLTGVLLILLTNLPGIGLGQNRAYYLNNRTGNDQNTGSRNQPWKTIQKLNATPFQAGDTIFLQGGQTFTGTLQLSKSGAQSQPIVLTSAGADRAVIDGGNNSAVIVREAEFVTVYNLKLRGNGRKTGNTGNGITVWSSQHISVDSVDVSGFQHSGVRIDSSRRVRVTRVNAHDNGFAGILVTGHRSKIDCRDIYIGHCRAENNPGDPSVLTNHSGNGILAGLCSNVLIEYCAATNNGWDMPRNGNGPVGIWAYEADSVVIQHCLSYRNKTSLGGEDGGGFDLDGGVTNSVIQYCLSYENQGSAFGLFQYAGASPWYNNTIRYNISENDGAVSAAKAGIYIWNSSSEADPPRQCFVYNNLIYNAKGVAIRYAKQSAHRGFYFYNNLFIAKDELMSGNYVGDEFLGNNWWSLTSGFHISGEKDFKNWAAKTRKERWEGKVAGLNLNPNLPGPGRTTITSPLQLPLFSAYQLPGDSPLRAAGLDLKTVFGIDPGSFDFNGQPAPPKGIGASF